MKTLVWVSTVRLCHTTVSAMVLIYAHISYVKFVSWSKVVPTTSIWAMTWQNQQNECAPSVDPDQPGHLPILIRVFKVHTVGNNRTRISSHGLWRLIRLDWCLGWFEFSPDAHPHCCNDLYKTIYVTDCWSSLVVAQLCFHFHNTMKVLSVNLFLFEQYIVL